MNASCVFVERMSTNTDLSVVAKILKNTDKKTHKCSRNLCGSWVFDEEKSIEGNESDGEGGEEDARGLSRCHQFANILLQNNKLLKMMMMMIRNMTEKEDKVMLCTFLLF